MTIKPDSLLDKLVTSGQQHLLCGGLKGLEKECLRISNTGMIAQTPHPVELGSALAHPHITTDYSEALLEFITPPFQDTGQALAFLDDIHRYVYANINDEILLATSMPCGIMTDHCIPIAQYGSSNIGRMKTVYRHGLGHRYGRTMQAIAGVHFNYSLPEPLWPALQNLSGSRDTLGRFKDNAYFGIIRNIQRLGWLVLYLFGASPAICKAFLSGRKQKLPNFQKFDDYTLYRPFATSLRMSDIGYKSSTQALLDISYDNLASYVTALTKAIETPHPEYQEIGVKINGQYQQLNANILQIENEFYSTIRPKQIINPCEKPTIALERRGVRYVELRSLDIDVYSHTGVTDSTLLFLEALILHSLLTESPPIDLDEDRALKQNILSVAYEGRNPNLELVRGDQSVKLRQWAKEICESMRGICEVLDSATASQPYSKALEIQIEAIADAGHTPSARILAEMRETGSHFAEFALQTSHEYAHHYHSEELSSEIDQKYKNHAKMSVEKQLEIEEGDNRSFDDFLACYFSQKCD
ncbi:MAG: glutamate--cysteine ligase [Methylococcales bacterium]